MSKRGATDQITKDNFNERDDDDEPQVFKASAEVMAKRKIIQPKRRNIASASSASSASSTPSVPVSGKPAFAGLNGSSTSEPANPFKLSKSTASTTSSSTTNSSTSSSPAEAVKNNKIKALNNKLVSTLASKNTEGTVANFTPLLNKYIQYYKDIEAEYISSSTTESNTTIPSFTGLSSTSANSATTTSKPIIPVVQEKKEEPIQVESDSDSDSEDDVKVEGPKFTLTANPTTKSSPFTFDPKKLAKKNERDDSDSESEIEIKGPTFTFNKPIKDAVFKLPSDKPANSLFNFGTTNDAAKSEEKKLEEPKPDEPKPAFSFTPTTNSTASTEKKDPVLVPFSFGSASVENKDNDKPGFSHTSTSSEEKKETQKHFAFNSTTAATAEPNQAFSFGQSQPTTLFGSSAITASAKKDETKPTFSFGISNTNGEKNAEHTKPLSSFNPTDTENRAEQPKPLFSFNPPVSSEKKTDSKPASFSFGSATSEKNDSQPSPFSFGSAISEKKNEVKPSTTLSFGSNNGNTFGFGQKNGGDNNETSTKPAFSFSFNPTASSGSDSSAKPAFTLGSTNGSSVFGNSSATNAFSVESTTSESKDTDKDDDKVQEEETGGDFAPVAQLGSEKVESVSGEELEDTLYTKRAKLMLFDPSSKENPYVNKGVGDLKVLKNKETQKSRVLIRADGGLRVLLNIAISKDMTYTQIGNGSMVRIPTVNPLDTSKIETYVLKVKTPSDGADLLKHLDDNKS
ncbi:nuclear pore protein [Scheffersomyces stipitis CBS 6054]|uniref:Nuclear pore protein n=1 Tax=Scheffersomyces stipitis (strain ATCC 58785 / CBS 6054 / NBRC 10063 / NRRL Y-11545) TaxID=322104 RepID=A3LVB8_PICST|nr:nuclear pore protein [Scheffersomyces stipitis CBS 6054]ABN67093.2 nuclear pore protein [Scheffersomyces stipitis CBS 6054]